MRILLAEDTEINRQLALRLLERTGHTVTLASDGEDACARYLASPDAFDLILMDLQMPRLNGVEATRRIRRHERECGGRTPILALTANATAERLAVCLAAGMDGGVSKPLDVHEVEAAVARLTGTEPAPGRAASHESPVLGWEAALELVLGDEALLRDMAGLFLGRAGEMLAEIEDTHTRGATRELQRATHKLKGSVANFGAQRAIRACGQVEAAAEAGDIATAGEHLPALRSAVEAVCTELRRRMGETGA